MRYAPILFLISAGCASIALAAPLPEADSDARSSSNSFEFLSIKDAATHTDSNSETRDIKLSDDTSDISARGAKEAAEFVGVCVHGMIVKFRCKLEKAKIKAARTRARVGAIFCGSGSGPHNSPYPNWDPQSPGPSSIGVLSFEDSQVHHDLASGQNIPTSSSPAAEEYEIPLPPGADPRHYYMQKCSTAP